MEPVLAIQLNVALRADIRALLIVTREPLYSIHDVAQIAGQPNAERTANDRWFQFIVNAEGRCSTRSSNTEPLIIKNKRPEAR